MAGLETDTKITLVRLFLFAVYVLIGAAVFQALEGPHQSEEIAKFRKIRRMIVLKYNITGDDAIQWASTYQANRPPGKGGEFQEWTFGNAFTFAMVVVTTIGYGNLVPKTTWGRLFCMVFAFWGIPGTCLTLKSIGDRIAQHVSLFVRTVERRCLKIQSPKKVGLKTSLITVVTTLVVFLPLLACIVYVREPQWTYLECFYFTFITLSTIGFGDFLPSFNDHVDYLLIIVAFVGLSLVSGIFCSLNFWLENHGASVRLVRSFRGRGRAHQKRNSVTADLQRDENDLTPSDLADDAESARCLDSRRVSNLEPPSTQNSGLRCDRKQEKRGSSVSLQLGIFRL